MPLGKSLLLVVDVQEGFVTNDAARAIIPIINKLITSWQDRKWPVVLSKFINKPNSPWVRFMDWQGCMNENETALQANLKTDYGTVYEKTAYSAWSPEVSQECISAGVESVVICGVDTDQCVLATAVEVFDAGLQPIIISDCCASSAGEEFHNAGMKLVTRLIGEKQIKTSKEVL